MLRRIKEEVISLGGQAWLQDDGTLIGNRDSLLSAVAILEEDGPPRGFHLQRNKSYVYCPDHDPADLAPLGAGFQRSSNFGFKFLGSDEFIRGFLSAKLDTMKETLDKLPDLKDIHTQSVLLRSCHSLPKISYLTRTVPSEIITAEMSRFDDNIRETLEEFVGGRLSEVQWTQQASLPVSMAGLGLRQASLHSSAAYLASKAASSSVIRDVAGKLKPAVVEEELGVIISDPHYVNSLVLYNSYISDPQPAEAVFVSSQKALSFAVDTNSFSLLESQLEDHDLARVKSAAVRHSGDWLNCVPNKSLGLHLRNQEYILSVKYLLGIPVFSSAGPCVACGRHSDVFGHHAVGCGMQGERIARHDGLRDVLYISAKQAGLAPRREERSLLSQQGWEMERPGDIVIPNWRSGRDAALDISVISPMQAVVVRRAARESGAAEHIRFNQKMRRYHDACQEAGIDFVPLPVSTMGGWHPEAVKVISKVGSALASTTGREKEEVTRHLFQRLAVQLVRGNVSLILSRIPAFAPAYVDGDQDISTD